VNLWERDSDWRGGGEGRERGIVSLWERGENEAAEGESARLM